MRRVLGQAALVAFASLVLLLLSPLSRASVSAEAFELVPGVVAHPTSDALYLMLPGGGIERVSISSGNRIWESSRAGKPLALADDQLLAQVESAADGAELEVVLLDVDDGRTVNRTLRVALPSGVRPTIDERLGGSFVARGEILGSTPYLSWIETRRYTKGVPPGPDETLRETREAAYQVDLVSGGLVEVEPTAVTSRVMPLPASVQSWMTANPGTERPVETGTVIAATRVVDGMTSASGRIVLERWDAGTGVPLPAVEIFRGPHILQARSADGRHLLVTERRAPGDFEEYEWSVFELESGERVGKLRHHQSHSPFFVDGSNVILVRRPYLRRVGPELVQTPLAVEARVLGSGTSVWERPLRDTSYRGPFPP